MKLVGIGDLFIPKEYIEKGFQSYWEMDVEVETVEWMLTDFNELQKINLMVEKGGCEAYEPPQYIFDACEDADIIITQFCTITKKLMDHCKHLKIIGVLRAGIENVNLAYASEKNILVYHTPGRNADAVADFTIGLLLSECRNIARGHMGLKNGKWIREYPNSFYIPDLPGKTVGIVGLGEIGQKVAKRLVGFDVKLLGYDPYVLNPLYGIEMCSLEELMGKSDFVTVHVRHTSDTENLINRKLISRMKPTAYLINTSRSIIVDEDALFEALRDKKIAGAGLDVFNVEPPTKDYPMIAIDNVTVTPHMAGGSKDAFLNSPKKLAEGLKGYWSKEESRYLVNKDLLGKMTATTKR
ncbi:MAG: 2-hydroxyacid dehydrogenase [Clostridia bacterium]|nr:2-hydroxyacid dehydrogenase [Clostridia bacterium]